MNPPARAGKPGGEKVTPKISAKYADYTNFDGSPEVFSHKSDVLERHCTALGRDFDSIVRSANYNVAIGSTEKEVEDRLTQLEDRLGKHVGTDKAAAALENFRNVPAVGTPEQIVENLTAMKANGSSTASSTFPKLPTIDPESNCSSGKSSQRSPEP